MSKRFRRRLLLFSLLSAVVVFAILLVIFLGIQVYLSYSDLGELNRETFTSVTCNETCNTDEFSEDWSLAGADYVLSKDGFFLFSTHFENFYIEFSDPAFFDQFDKPTRWTSPIEGEVWVLYATESDIDKRKAKIMVGWLEEMPGLLARTPASKEVEKALMLEAEKIATQLDLENGQLVSGGIKSKVDGFQIVDAETGRIIDWGGSIPAYLPQNAPKGGPIYIGEEKNIYLVRDEIQGNVRAISLASVANLDWLLAVSLLTLVTVFVLSYIGSRTFFKKWLLLYAKKIHSVGEALRSGESQEIEFKRGIVDDEVLRSITAFANTNDGVIFIGVDDVGKVSGLSLGSAKAKERFIHKIFSLARRRINPVLSFRVDFESLRDLEIARIFVPRGDEPLYYLDGMIYVRHGDSDVRAKPELVKKVLSDFSF